MTYLLDPIVLKPGGMFFIENQITGERTEVPSYTCGHCSRVVAMRRDRKRPRNKCRSCMKQVCDSGGCLASCNTMGRDTERAYVDLQGQPWMLRNWGEPVVRLWMPDGSEILVERKKSGYTEREIERTRRPGGTATHVTVALDKRPK